MKVRVKKASSISRKKTLIHPDDRFTPEEALAMFDRLIKCNDRIKKPKEYLQQIGNKVQQWKQTLGDQQLQAKIVG